MWLGVKWLTIEGIVSRLEKCPTLVYDRFRRDKELFYSKVSQNRNTVDKNVQEIGTSDSDLWLRWGQYEQDVSVYQPAAKKYVLLHIRG